MTDTETVGESPLDPDAVEPGTSVLVAGEPFTNKRELLFDLLDTPDCAAALVSTKRSAAKLQEQFGAHYDLGAWDLRIVDCVSKQQSVGDVRETERLRYVSSPGDLTGIGIEVSGFLQEFYHRDDLETARLGFDSLSPVLMYADLRRVYQFLHVVTGRLASSGFEGVFTLDTVGGDDQLTSRLTQVFDALVEVRRTERGRELRVRGGAFGPATWTPF